MATGPTLAALDAARVPRRHGLARSGALSGYWSLTKPEVNFHIAVTAAALCFARVGQEMNTKRMPRAMLVRIRFPRLFPVPLSRKKSTDVNWSLAFKATGHIGRRREHSL
jgi:hypothetical protein